jgi:hypothetical protein
VKAYTSRARFDEARRYLGVHAQMGRVLTDADHNEEVALRLSDARRRSADTVRGAPDDGFRLDALGAVDVLTSTAGWAGPGLAPGDARYIAPELVLDRYLPESLPFVVRARGYREILRTLPAPVSLAQVPRGAGATWAASALVFEVRFDVLPGDDEPSVVRMVLIDGAGNRSEIDNADLDARPSGWLQCRVPLAGLANFNGTLAAWGLTGLPPRATVRIATLLGEDAALGSDFVIRGGDNSIVGAGRMYVGGARAFLEGDLRYRAQPDFPEPPALIGVVDGPGGAVTVAEPVPVGATPYHLAWLDVWEREVTVDEDPFLAEPALDGLDTTFRSRLVAQVRVLPQLLMETPGQPRPSEALPTPVGGARLSTDIAEGALPNRYPAAAPDSCRDRCLHTEQAALGAGYRGSENLHVRVELLDVGGRTAVLWSRDNASTLLPLVADAGDTATRVYISAENATRLQVGNLVVIEDEVTRLFGGRAPVLRQVRSLTPDLGDGTGAVELAPVGASTGLPGDPLPLGGATGRALRTSERAALRVWDGADWAVENVRYNLPDGLAFGFTTLAAARSGDWWTFTARVHDPDGDGRGVVERLLAAAPHGPVHHSVPLARIRYEGGARTFEDLRPRYLPLEQVRDRLVELGEGQPDKGPFCVIIGDGVRTFGDIDQDLLEGATADECLQAALARVSEGGTIFFRAGHFVFERPVVVTTTRSIRLLGEGDATELHGVGAGGVLYLDACRGGQIDIADLALRTDPGLRPDLGAPGGGGQAVTGVVPTDPPSDVALLVPQDLRGGTPLVATPLAIAQRWNQLSADAGRVAAAVRRTLDRLRQIQRANPGIELDNIPGARTLFDTLQALPHGAVNVVDAEGVTIRNCRIVVNESDAHSAGAFVTGTCRSIRLDGNRITAPVGVLAAPYAAWLSDNFLFGRPRAGLAIDGLDVVDNEITAGEVGVRGVQVADGRLDGLRVRDNVIRGYDVGVVAEDRDEYQGGEPSGHVAVEGNHIVDFGLVGIQAGADRMVIRQNELRSAPSADILSSAGLYSAGIQVVGQGVVVEGNHVRWSATGNAPVLGVLAGIVVGDGLDDGSPTLRPVHDVVVAGNRIEGLGEDLELVGVWVGGPQPIADIHVRENSFSDLGDAAVRVFGARAVTGVHVEDNRIDRVALTELPAVEADLGVQLASLGAVPTSLAGITRPEALLAALLALTNPSTAHLDASLRWLERLYLRGAIVLSNVEASTVSGNHVASVGLVSDVAPQRQLTDVVRTAAICVVGGRDVVVQDNRVTEVRAPGLRGGEEAENTAGDTVPDVVGVLDRLGVGRAGVTVSSAGMHFGQADLHAAVASLRRLFITYIAGVDSPDDAVRTRIGRRVYGPLDALAWRLRQTAEAPPEVADALESVTAAMRSAQHQDAHTKSARLVVSVLSQLARATADAGPPQEIWEEIAAWDQAIYDAHGGTLTLASRQVAGAIFGPEVWDVVPVTAQVPGTVPAAGSDRRLERQIVAAAVNAPSPQTLATGLLALDWLAALHDAWSAEQNTESSDSLLGDRRDPVKKLATGAKRLVGQARVAMGSTGGAAEAQAALAKARPQIAGLALLLADAHSSLAGLVDTAFRVLDTVPAPAPATLQDPYGAVTTALEWVEEWADGRGADVLQPGAGTSADDPRPVARADLLVTLQNERGATSTSLVCIDHLDAQLATCATATVPALMDASVNAAFGLSAQVRSLVYDRPALRTLATPVWTGLRSATTATDTARGPLLEQARVALAKLRRAVEIVVAPGTVSFGAVAAPLVDQRLAGIAALGLRLAADETSAVVAAALRESVRKHFSRALDETRTLGEARASAESAMSTALSSLTNAAGEAKRRAAQDVVELAATLADAVSTRAGATGPLRATAILARAAVGALESAPAVSDLHAVFLAKSDDLSATLVADLTASTSVPLLRQNLRDALEQLAAGDDPAAGEVDLPDLRSTFEPADGIFAAAVLDGLRISGNEVHDVLFGVAVVGRVNQVFADVPRVEGAEADVVVVEISGNHLASCAATAIDVRPGATVTAWVRVQDNRVHGCADLALTPATLATSDSPNDAADLASSLGQGVVRIVGSGELLFTGNMTWENGNTTSRAMVHECLVDWRGSVVVRQNTLRHFGGGAGGAGLLLLPEALTTTVRGGPGALVRRLVSTRFLAVEPPPAAVTTKALADKEVRRTISLRQSDAARLPRTPITSTYLTRKTLPVAPVRFMALSKALIWRVPRFTLPTRPPARQRYVVVEGNDIDARGPALLVLGQGADIIATTVVGNELRSTGRSGAVYLRHTDSTVVTGNRIQCVGAVNVLVVRPDAAPVTVTGNVALGDQPVSRTIRVAPGWQLLAQSSFAGLASTLLKGVALLGAPTTQVTVQQEAAAPTAPSTSDSARVASAPTASTLLKASTTSFKLASRSTIAPSVGSLILGASAVKPAVTSAPGKVTAPLVTLPGRAPVLTAQPPASTPPPPSATAAPTESRPDPGVHSVVVLGGTQVALIGNAATAGAVVLDAAYPAVLNP